jgi:hypothetical protein
VFCALLFLGHLGTRGVLALLRNSVYEQIYGDQKGSVYWFPLVVGGARKASRLWCKEGEYHMDRGYTAGALRTDYGMCSVLRISGVLQARRLGTLFILR